MKIQFLGADSTVTGSKHLLNCNETRVLIDCGLFQGKKEISLRNREELPFSPSELSAVILTHGHLDHCGYLPKLVKDGFSGPIYASAATLEIAKVILLDSAKIQEEDAKKFTSKKNPLSTPLYTTVDALECFNQFRAIDYKKEFHVNDIRFEIERAGHILGASSIYVHFKNKRVLFSGDLGRFNDPLTFDPTPPRECDLIVMESTYGNRSHQDSNVEEELEKILEKVQKERKVLLVPSFAVARAQLFLFLLTKIFKRRPELKIPAFVNSPMTKEVTDLYEKFEFEHKLSSLEFTEAMSSARFLEWSKEYSKLNKKKGPAIIVAASGMVSGGRILEHLDHFGKDANNIVLLIGYQGEGTIGRSLLIGEREIQLLGHKMEVRSEVRLLENLSAHADREELLRWIESAENLPEKIALVHGEDLAQEELKSTIEEKIKIPVILAKDHKSIEVE